MNTFNNKLRANVKSRAALIVRQYRSGIPLGKIAAALGLSRQSVWQSLRDADVARTNGKGRPDRPDIDVSNRRYLMLRLQGAVRAYQTQRGHALAMKIPWEFTLSSWWKLWSSSGKWKLRGKNGGKSAYYVMARFQDCGPYSPQNCRICSKSDNVKEALLRETMIRRGIIEELFDKDGRAFQPDRKFRRLVSW